MEKIAVRDPIAAIKVVCKYDEIQNLFLNEQHIPNLENFQEIFAKYGLTLAVMKKEDFDSLRG